MLRPIINDIEIVEEVSILNSIQQNFDILINLDCHIEYEKLFKEISDRTPLPNIIEFSTTANMVRHPNTSLNRIVILTQPIIGTIRVIISRIKALMDSIKNIKISLNCEALNNRMTLPLCREISTYNSNLLQNYIPISYYIEPYSNIEQFKIEQLSDERSIEILVEGTQFNKERRIIYRIIGKNNANCLPALEAYTYIQLITSKIVNNGVLTPEDIGRDEGLFTYYMSNLITDKLEIGVTIEVEVY